MVSGNLSNRQKCNFNYNFSACTHRNAIDRQETRDVSLEVIDEIRRSVFFVRVRFGRVVRGERCLKNNKYYNFYILYY